MSDLAIVSRHEKGFPQADFYKDCGDMEAEEFELLGATPDDFFTMKREDSLAMASAIASVRWPGVKIKIAAGLG